jgi:signal transduction histidine kinase
MIELDSSIKNTTLLYINPSKKHDKVMDVISELVLEIQEMGSIEEAKSFYDEHVYLYQYIIVLCNLEPTQDFDYNKFFNKYYSFQKDVPSLLVISPKKTLVNMVSKFNIKNFILSPLEKDSIVNKLYTMTEEIGQLLEFDNLNNELFLSNKQKEEQANMLLHQSKLAIMGEMISMIAHQWKQPLAGQRAMIGGIQFKKKLGKLNDDFLDENLNSIDDLCVHMAKTIDDFADFFKPNKEKRKTNIKNAIEDCISLTSGVFKKNGINIDILCDNTSDLELTIYDREFKQVVINILNNAKDALVENKIEDKKILVDISKTYTKVIISIADNAGGIPAFALPKLFEPYFSTKSKNGTGLGLYMSKIIIDDHLSGKLSAFNSDPGAVFKIELDLDIE